MLPPFRIRNLRPSNSSADRNAHGERSTALEAPNHHSIVQVSAPEYDATVSRHPEATLKYMDEDDGEVITVRFSSSNFHSHTNVYHQVGSSLELAQRLQEPVVPPSRSSTQSPPFLYPTMPRLANPRLSTISPELHIFDIDRTPNGALFLWRSIERRNAYSFRSVSPSTTSLDSRPLPVESSEQGSYKDILERPVSDVKVKIDTMEKASCLTEPKLEREHYFKVTNPPNPTWEPVFDPAPENRTSPDEYNLMTTEPEYNEFARATNPLLRSHAPELAELTKEWGSLSSEGRKQAEEAGLKLSCSIKKPTSHSFHGTSHTKAHQDRWAAYSRIHPAPQPQEAKGRNQQGTLDTDEPKEPHRPLLEVFEAELARLLSEAPPLSASETSAPHFEPATDAVTSEATSESETARNIDGDVPDTPVELLVHAVRGFIDGVGLLASEVRSNLPVAQEHIAIVQQNIPQTVQQTVSSAFRGIGSHVHSIANNVQSIATRNAADRTHGVDVQALEAAVFGLRGVANGIGDFSRALFPGPSTESATKPGEGLPDNSAELTAFVKVQAHQLDDNPTDEARAIDAVTPIIVGQGRDKDSAESNFKEPNADSSLHTSSGDPKSKYAPDEYERIHRMKREEAAEKREASRQEVQKNQQDAKETQVHPIFFPSATRPEVPEHENSHFEFEQRDTQYEQLNSPRPASAASTNNEQGPHFSKGCVFGCSSGPSCRHRRATGGLPYPSRNDFHRGRHPRRPPPHFTSQLPYEYVVPPPGFYNGSNINVTGNMLRHNGSRHYARSRSPSTSPRRSSPPSRMNPPPGWPQFPRHGPIHLPQSLHHGPDTSHASRPARFQPSRPLPPPAPWVEPRTHAAPSDHRRWNNQCGLVPTNPFEGITLGDHGVGRNSNLLRHRQSWHPSLGNRLPERWDTTRPERPTVSFAEPTVASARAKTSSVPWDRAVRHRRSTGALTARGMHDSMARDLPSPIAQPRVGPTERTVSAKSADTVRSCKHDSRGNNSYEHITYGPAGDEKAMWMARDENGISDIGTSVATIRDISAQDALRPSPVSASSLPKRAATIATVTSKDRHMVSSKLPSLSSVLESLPTQNMMPEMTCFPALAQLEDGASRNAPSFPPLPTMEPLIPMRTDLHASSTLAPKEEGKTNNGTDVGTRSSSTPRARSFQPDAPEANESSGEFFRRMTGLGTPPNKIRPTVQPARPAKLIPAQVGATLAGPFDPLAESVTLHRSRLMDGVRRSVTERRPHPDHYAVNRRPYSEYFTGNGRLGWESFLASHDNTPRRVPTAANNNISSEQIDTVVVPSIAELKQPPEDTIKTTEEHDDASTVKVVQECVDQLKNLGFGTGENGGIARLLVYAQAAEGDLEDAIEMIEEERKAYKQRSSN